MKDKRVLTSTEISKLLSLSDIPINIRIAVSLMVYYFLNDRQVAELKWSDLLHREDGLDILYKLKDEDKALKLPLRKDLEELIRQNMKARGRECGYLVADSENNPYEAEEIQAWINKVCLEIGLENNELDYLLNDNAFSIDNVVAVRQSSFQTITVMDVGGVFVTPIYFKAVFPACNIDVIEIDPEMFTVAKEYFGFDKYENRESQSQNLMIFATDAPNAFDEEML